MRVKRKSIRADMDRAVSKAVQFGMVEPIQLKKPTKAQMEVVIGQARNFLDSINQPWP